MNKCNIIRDLLPLYTENMVSGDSAEYVEKHLESCNECRAELEKIKEPEKIHQVDDRVPLMSIRKKLMMKRIQTVILSVIMAVAVAVVAFSYITSPIYFQYTEDLVTVAENGDGSLLLTFREDVTSCSLQMSFSPDGPSEKYYTVEAWTTLLEQWTDVKTENRSLTVYPAVGMPNMTLYYTQNNGQEDVCIYGEAMTNGGVITLPRLALNYYLFVALVLLAVLIVLRLVFRKKPRAKLRFERALLLPFSYIISHVAICGISGTSYSMTRDFELILLVTILLYCVALLVHNIVHVRREIRKYI